MGPHASESESRFSLVHRHVSVYAIAMTWSQARRLLVCHLPRRFPAFMGFRWTPRTRKDTGSFIGRELPKELHRFPFKDIADTRLSHRSIHRDLYQSYSYTRNSINIDWCSLNLKTCNDAHRDDRFLSTVSKNHIYILCLPISEMFPQKFVKARPLFFAVYVYVHILIGIRSLRYAIMTYQLQKRFIKMFRVFGYVVGRRYRKVTLMTNR